MTADTIDVAKELRERALEMHAAAWSRPDGGRDCTIGASLCDAAADEIERLTAENERMRGEIQTANDGWHYADGCAELAMKHRDEAETEIERLRGVLNDIASGKYSGIILPTMPPKDPAVEAARAALAEGGKDG